MQQIKHKCSLCGVARNTKNIGDFGELRVTSIVSTC